MLISTVSQPLQGVSVTNLAMLNIHDVSALIETIFRYSRLSELQSASSGSIVYHAYLYLDFTHYTGVGEVAAEARRCGFWGTLCEVFILFIPCICL